MKRISLSVIAVAIIAAAGVNARMNMSNEYVSPLTLANIQALAVNGEDLGGSSHSLTCSGTVGICQGECSVHQQKLTKTGSSATATFTCSGF